MVLVPMVFDPGEFAVITGTTDSTVGNTVLKDYPSGWTKDNCMVVAFDVNPEGTKVPYGIIKDGSTTSMIDSVALAAQIRVTTRTSYGAGVSFRVMLRRIDL